MMKKLLLTLCVVSLIMPVFSAFPAAAQAEENGLVSGTYHFTSSHSTRYQCEDHFTFDEAWFTRSSFEVSAQLTELSAQVCLASIGVFGNGNDDPADDADNIMAMLRDMGFLDVEVNAYYTMSRLEDSFAVAAARREITVDGKTFTLLAVIPCSGGYAQEWSGNFNVGEGDLHEGFRLARDEALRFTKQYLERYGIAGDVKIWLGGHSRGGAVVNLLGGFLAGGGIGYFDGIRVAPEDIYCYTFAAPCGIVPGASAQEVLRVSGARGGIYEADTPGEAWNEAREGIIRPDDTVYQCIHNFCFACDLIPTLPPEAWGLTRYGVTLSLGLDGALDADAMVQVLQELNPVLYDDFTRGGDWREYEPKAPDLANLGLVRDPDAGLNASAQDLALRLTGTLSSLAQNCTAYVQEGLQETLMALSGLYGMLRPEESILPIDPTPLIRPAILCCLTNGMEQLTAEGRISADAPDSEKAALVLTDLLSWLTGTDLDPQTATLDDVYVALVSWLLANEDTSSGRAVLSALASRLENNSLSGLIGSYLAPFVPDADSASTEEKLRAFLRATVEGPLPGTPASEKPELYTPESQRNMLFTVMTMGSYLPWGMSGTSSVRTVTEYLCQKLTNGAGSLTEAADASIREALDYLLGAAVEGTARFGEDVHEQAARHLETLKTHAGLVRTFLNHLLFINGDEAFSVEAMLRNIATFIGNANILQHAHYNETYVAWAKVWVAQETPDAE